MNLREKKTMRFNLSEEDDWEEEDREEDDWDEEEW